MRWAPALLFLIAAGSSWAMQIDADPRTIISSMDKALLPELDILRVTTAISGDDQVVFQVKTRGERIDRDDGDYLLLQISGERAHILLIPINQPKGNGLIYEGLLQPEGQRLPQTFNKADEKGLHPGFSAKHILHGGEFSIPVEWMDFGSDFSFDAYTVKADIRGNTLTIGEIHDWARKGREEKRISAIALLNKLCAPGRAGRFPSAGAPYSGSFSLQQNPIAK